MSAKREKVLDLSHRIMAMRTDARRMEENLQRMKAEIRALEEVLDRLLEGGEAGSASRSQITAEDLVRAAIRNRTPGTGEPPATESSTLGAKIITLLVSAGPQQIFPVSLVAKVLNESPNTIRTVMWRLAKGGEIVKVDKGLYRAKRPGEVVVPKPDEDDAEVDGA
ncbi:MAG: hypothetical protein EOO70_05935 [Myxococcaceae bacterium]|nr:MAG: hypothetical protein EOO70_05935 [Myxococcaceae bacterium]